MNPPTENQKTHADKAHANKHKPWPLITIIGMVAFVLLSGYVLSPKTEEQRLAWVTFLGTTNQGTLLNPPTEINAGQIVDSAGNPWQAMEDNTWKLLVLNEGVCADACVDRLDELHAMRIRLHRDADRLTVGLLATEPQVLPEAVVEYHDINNLHINDAALLVALEQTNMPRLAEGPVVLMINPIDVFMMSYGAENTGGQMLEDFEHLLDLAH